jgi:nicotinamide riboside transporter PnuC
MTWIIAIMSIAGVVLNIYKNKYCFVIWMITNFSWMIIDFYKGIYSQAFLFLIYFILAVYGFIKWIMDGKKKEIL